jgi:hypothetical protein
MRHTEAFSRGFDRGNYGHAYESEDFESWYDRNDIGNKSADYCEGAILGFFSSYELTEISDEVVREDVRILREKWGES